MKIKSFCLKSMLLISIALTSYADGTVTMLHEGYVSELVVDTNNYLLLLEFAETSNKSLIELLEENLLTKKDSLFYALEGVSDEKLLKSICKSQIQSIEKIQEFRHLYYKSELLEISQKLVHECKLRLD